MSDARQRALPLGFHRRRAMGRSDFVVAPSNADAAALVSAPDTWPEGRLALVGPKGAGKTHLARVFMADTGAALVEAARLRSDDPPALLSAGAFVVEDVDALPVARERAAAETALFHLLNAAAAQHAPVLLTGVSAPGRWPAQLPDLASRLAALTVVRLGPPDDALLEAVIAKLFSDRDLTVEPELPHWLALRIERSFEAAADAVSALDDASLSRGGRITRRLAAKALGL